LWEEQEVRNSDRRSETRGSPVDFRAEWVRERRGVKGSEKTNDFIAKKIFL
jgi:hypothetical protein